MDNSVPSGRELEEEQEMDQLGKDLEKIIDSVENMSVQLTWMAYDMVVLRTCPQVGESLQKLEEEFFRCKAVLQSKPLEKVTPCQEEQLLSTVMKLIPDMLTQT
uniref:Zgc:194246 n=1 Tax=Scleropages formosus TaxID=113540 RepID=A0A8C9VIF0_SCLFO